MTTSKNIYYNTKNHIKFSKSYKDSKKHKKLIDALEEGSKQNHQFIVYSSICEKYAYELIVYGGVAMNIAEQNISDDEKKLLKKIQKGEMTDKNFKANMEKYLNFKTNVKYSKIIEVKLNDKNIDNNEKEYLNNELSKTLETIETIAKSFHFHTNNPKEALSFSTSQEFINFLDSKEQNYFRSYREHILDAEEIINIYQSSTSELFEVALKTKDKMNSNTLISLDKFSTQLINNQ